jgi:hypothetical protein
MSNDTEPAQPDAAGNTDIEAMSLEAVQAELRSTAAGAVRIQEHLERRQRLWRRLDALTKSSAAARSTGRMAGINEGN